MGYAATLLTLPGSVSAQRAWSTTSVRARSSWSAHRASVSFPSEPPTLFVDIGAVDCVLHVTAPASTAAVSNLSQSSCRDPWPNRLSIEVEGPYRRDNRTRCKPPSTNVSDPRSLADHASALRETGSSVNANRSLRTLHPKSEQRASHVRKSPNQGDNF